MIDNDAETVADETTENAEAEAIKNTDADVEATINIISNEIQLPNGLLNFEIVDLTDDSFSEIIDLTKDDSIRATDNGNEGNRFANNGESGDTVQIDNAVHCATSDGAAVNDTNIGENVGEGDENIGAIGFNWSQLGKSSCDWVHLIEICSCSGKFHRFFFSCRWRAVRYR